MWLIHALYSWCPKWASQGFSDATHPALWPDLGVSLSILSWKPFLLSRETLNKMIMLLALQEKDITLHYALVRHSWALMNSPPVLSGSMSMTYSSMVPPMTSLAGLRKVLDLCACLGFLVPASPNNIGASFLRHVYTDLHAKHNQTYTTPLEFYYEEVVLSPLGRLDLTWWLTALTTGLETSIQPTKHAHLGVAWGDGSSSGTGGTFEWVAPDSGPLPVMCTWMGTWTPHVHRFPSNWRELCTLTATLSPTDRCLGDLKDTHLFYFSDNSAVYNIAHSRTSPSPELHKLVQHLKLLELQQGCQVDVIHVPGTTMIQQGMDGQSRGLWLSPLNQPHRNITADLFHPAPMSSTLLQWVASVTNTPMALATFFPVENLSPWTLTSLLHCHCIWSLSPTLA